MILVGDEALKGYKAKIRATKKVNVAKHLKDNALNDGQKVSEVVLYAEAKLGELLSETVKERGEITLGSHGRTKSLPGNIDKKHSHYAQEFYRNPDLIKEALSEAKEKEDIATRHTVLKLIKEKKREEKIQKQKEEIEQGLEKPDGLFDIIVVDPPWKFDGSYDAEGRRGTAPYPTMTHEKIKEIILPAKDDCILWLWTTHKDIFATKEIFDYWGFSYKGIIVWDKEKMGIGTWLRFQCEFCLLGIKGKPLWEHKDIRDIIHEPRREHSVKPECFFDMIDKKFVGRKLDYFGRKKRKGWEIYGAGQSDI